MYPEAVRSAIHPFELSAVSSVSLRFPDSSCYLLKRPQCPLHSSRALVIVTTRMVNFWLGSLGDLVDKVTVRNESQRRRKRARGILATGRFHAAFARRQSAPRARTFDESVFGDSILEVRS